MAPSARDTFKADVRGTKMALFVSSGPSAVMIPAFSRVESVTLLVPRVAGVITRLPLSGAIRSSALLKFHCAVGSGMSCAITCRLLPNSPIRTKRKME